MAVVLSGCDGGGPGLEGGLTGRPDARLTKLVAEIEGVGALDRSTPIEVYGDAFGVVNEATIVAPDSVLLFLDGERIKKVESQRDVQAKIAPDRFPNAEHTLRLTAHKQFNGQTRTASDRRTLRFD